MKGEKREKREKKRQTQKYIDQQLKISKNFDFKSMKNDVVHECEHVNTVKSRSEIV